MARVAHVTGLIFEFFHGDVAGALRCSVDGDHITPVLSAQRFRIPAGLLGCVLVVESNDRVVALNSQVSGDRLGVLNGVA